MVYVGALQSGFYAKVPIYHVDALESLEHSIQATQKRVETQKKIKQLLAEYDALQQQFLEEVSSKNDIWRMVKISDEMYKLIESEHLQPLFSPEFLEELKVFSAFATKSTISLKQ